MRCNLCVGLIVLSLIGSTIPVRAELPPVTEGKVAALDTSGAALIDEELRDFLNQFESDQATAQMAARPSFSADGSAIASSAFSKITSVSERLSEDFQLYVARLKQNQFCVGDLGAPEACLYSGVIESIEDLVAQDGRRGIGSNDDPRKLVDNGNDASYIDNLYRMQQEDLTEAKVGEQGWSSDYWALASGATAKRYQLEYAAELGFPSYPTMNTGMEWHEAAKYVESETKRMSYMVDYNARNPQNFFERYGANLGDFVALLSPAEKYDLLVGDLNFSLTKAQIESGRAYAFESNGSPKAVETWMGLCHGWAVAAYMDKRPAKTIEVYSASGTPVVFYPDDIKALSVLKWANGTTVTKDARGALAYGSKFIGGRCNKKDGDDIKTNDGGVVVDKDCFDTNPGAWHISIVNQIGVVNQKQGNRNRTLVIDATFDYEVWNQPLVSYKYSYFNPRTLETVRNIRAATVELNGKNTFKDDRFGSKIRSENYRNSRVKPRYVVGVVMEVAYVVETSPTGEKSDSANRDAITTVRYVYDLELDSDGKIVGGEWYNNTHPDFLWTAAPDAFAYNDSDLPALNQRLQWNSADTVLPANIAEIATSPQALRDATPLKVVVDGLIQKSAR